MQNVAMETDVLIVGAGPVGLFLANECARQGSGGESSRRAQRSQSRHPDKAWAMVFPDVHHGTIGTGSAIQVEIPFRSYCRYPLIRTYACRVMFATVSGRIPIREHRSGRCFCRMVCPNPR